MNSRRLRDVSSLWNREATNFHLNSILKTNIYAAIPRWAKTTEAKTEQTCDVWLQWEKTFSFSRGDKLTEVNKSDKQKNK